jgi:hypothetical protein
MANTIEFLDALMEKLEKQRGEAREMESHHNALGEEQWASYYAGRVDALNIAYDTVFSEKISASGLNGERGTLAVGSTDWLDALTKRWERRVLQWKVASGLSTHEQGRLCELIDCLKELRAEKGNTSNVRMSHGEGERGAVLIAEERRRQIEAEGYDDKHDDGHSDGELAMAAACYAAGEDATHVRTMLNSARGLEEAGYSYDYSAPKPGEITWPWDAEWYKSEPDRIRTLTKAGALIAAEIDRLNREKTGTTNHGRSAARD